ncbi:MAG: DUF1934 domain-containing protein [Roseburia sp.]|nr:DUF1934 domain-containing protein [Roseburia sp.]
MTKEVLVKITGLQFAEDTGNDSVEIITSGDYYKKNGKHYILYDEVQEGTADTTKNIIKLGTDMLDVTKRGVSNTHMLFEKDKKNMSYYYTPFGSVLVGIDAKKIDVRESEDSINVLVDYELEINYEHMADCKITMDIRSKGTGNFQI